MLKLFTPTRCLVLLACISWILVFSLVPRFDLLETHQVVHQPAPRDLLSPLDSSPSPPSPPPVGAPATSDTDSGPPSSQSSASATSSDSSTSSAPPTTPTSSPPPVSSGPTSDTSTSSSIPPSSPPPQSSAPPTPAPPPASPTVSQLVTTNSDGGTSIIYTTIYPSSSTPLPSHSANSDASSGGSSKSVGTSTIVGLSVAGGVALIGIIAFVIWKFTRKRFTDDFDDSEAIKWPELNAHGDAHALPANRTGGAGFETNSEVNLTRPDSLTGSTYASSAAASAVDLYAPNAAQDPYAVPPLPHLNPNQPYRDDPSGAYYDPYHGPLPQTFGDGVPHEAGAEAIPMTQINRSRSPGPQMAYDAGRRSPGPAYMGDMGRSSPAPRAVSPGPAAALAGRVSPGPQAAYGYGGGRQSPGPHMAYGS